MTTTLNAQTISREKFDRFSSLYRPIEDQYMAGLFDPKRREQQVDEAVSITGNAFDQQARAQDQTMSRYGMANGDVADFISRRRKVEQALAETSAANRARGLVDDRDLMGAQQVSALGRGLSAEVSTNQMASDTMQAQRDAAGEQAQSEWKTRKTSATVGGAATGAMIGAKYGSSAGPWGAVIGGVVGAGLGYATS